MNIIPIKELCEAEKILLRATLKIISEYGALGDKTTLKPSESDYKNKPEGHHSDYGIIELQKNESDQTEEKPFNNEENIKKICSYLKYSIETLLR